MIFDTHTHLNVANFAGREAEEIEKAREFGVTKLNIVGFDTQTIAQSLALSASYDNLYSTIGWHPTEAGSYTPEIEAMIIEHGVKVKALYISTLSLSENNVDSLVNIMLSGLCDELHLVVSSYFYSHERGNLIKYIYQELENEKPWKFFFSVAGTHMKLAMIKTDELKITMQGSANLRSSGNIEQFSIVEEENLFEFNKEYIEIIEQSYQINKKSGDRGNKLWHQVQKLKKEKKQEQGKRVQLKHAE